jgi:metal-responsive CopG/Arc/MetJ family transcriptional regulator
MSKGSRVAISLPSDLLHAVERERRSKGQSRSEFVRLALREFLEAGNRREALDRYIRGYERHPETPAEIEAEGAIGLAALAEEPWE